MRDRGVGAFDELSETRDGEAQEHQVQDKARRRRLLTYRVTWSEEDQEHVGTCLELPSLSWLAGSCDEAVDGIYRVVRDVVANMLESNPPPQPLSVKHYSGQFKVRIPPTLHRRLRLEAADQHISLNRLVSEKLAR